MITGPLLLVIFLVVIAVLLALIIRWRVNPFLALLLTAVLTGVFVGMPLRDIGGAIAEGFGNTLSGIGIVIGLGIVLGQVLVEAGATAQIANRLLKLTGYQRSPLAINAAGYLVSIPVFIDAAFVIFIPLVAQICLKTRKSWITFVTALSVGLITTHAMVVPTPGPLAVAGNMQLDVGLFLLYALVASLPASLVGGWLYGLWLGRRNGPQVSVPLVNASAESELYPVPSGNLALWVLLCPVLLILVGSIFGVLLPEDVWARSFFAFIGDKNVALLIAVLVALATLKRYIRKPAGEIVNEAAASAGLILLITGAGGAFGHIISSSGIGSYLVETMVGWNVSMLFLGFILSAILRAAQGSATVALITTSAILGPTIAAAGASPILVGLAICAGGMCLSLPNDSAFWVVSRFANLSVRDTLRGWTGGSTLAGLVALVVVLLLSQLRGILPGL